MVENLSKLSDTDKIELPKFKETIAKSQTLFKKLLNYDLIISQFDLFKEKMLLDFTEINS